MAFIKKHKKQAEQQIETSSFLSFDVFSFSLERSGEEGADLRSTFLLHFRSDFQNFRRKRMNLNGNKARNGIKQHF